MNNTKPIWQSKTIWALIFSMAAPWLNQKFGLVLDDAAQQAVLDKVIEGVGLLAAAWARLHAKQELTAPVVKPAGLVLPFVLASGLLTGCAWYQGLSPGAQTALQQAAKIALSFGVQELGQSVKEVRPFEGKLQGIISTTFAQVTQPEAIGQTLTARVRAEMPEELQPVVLAKFKEALTKNNTTAGGLGEPVSFNQRIARSL